MTSTRWSPGHVVMPGLVLIVLPALAYLFASRASFGAVILILPWSEDEGVHTGDLLICCLLAPAWLWTAFQLWRSLRSPFTR